MQKTISRRIASNNIALPDSIHPVLRRIYNARNISSARDLDYSLTGLLPYHSLLGIEQAVVLLADGLAGNKRFLIVADFDADGATGCALAMRGLRMMGATDVHYVVPNRFEYGYGLSPEIVEVAARHQPDILITVDNGISSIEGVALARAKNINVLITDHHLPGKQLPAANTIVNPNQQDDEFPSKHLAGVGVMFYLLVALRAHLREQGWFTGRGIEEPNLAELLDLVALGTMADVVPLDHNNRILVAQGLARIRAGRCCPGIRELLLMANRPLHRTTTQDLAFVVGPRLNAAGRLEDMSLGIECLLTDDETGARQMAGRLDQLNRERREIQEDMQAQALAAIAAMDLTSKGQMPNGLCLFNEEWHQGVIGILASKIKDRFHRPVIAFARDSGGIIKGSARSVEGVHIRDLLDTIASRHPGVIDKFGGHAMAAGLTLRECDLERFEELFHQIAGEFISAEYLDNKLVTDGELSAGELNFQLAEAIIDAGPWGQGFPEPVFDGRFEVINRKMVGSRHLQMQLRANGHDNILQAIAFNSTDHDWLDTAESVRTVYKLDINEYGGRRSLQLVVEHMTPA
ncbi:MAG: single-stranded-DNA-specific exonuclease RecJ [Gammaproteobacteria bacterium RBG_16_51_14]|nr:MAG: single-stranded-DNA-specific exonuclease RecJ [Gammaproteobacteria bacterium RBG_16_51_14]